MTPEPRAASPEAEIVQLEADVSSLKLLIVAANSNIHGGQNLEPIEIVRNDNLVAGPEALFVSPEAKWEIVAGLPEQTMDVVLEHFAVITEPDAQAIDSVYRVAIGQHDSDWAAGKMTQRKMHHLDEVAYKRYFTQITEYVGNNRKRLLQGLKDAMTQKFQELNNLS